MICAVGYFCAKQPGKRPHATSFDLRVSFHHHPHGTHTRNHPVPASIEWKGRLFKLWFSGNSTGCQKTAHQPRSQSFIGDVICSDDQNPVAPAKLDPVLCHGYRQGRGSTCRVHLNIGPPGPDEFSHLSMAKGQGLENELPVQMETISKLFFDLLDATSYRMKLADLFLYQTQFLQPGFKSLRFGTLLDPLEHFVITRECRSKNDACRIRQILGQSPPERQLLSCRSDFVMHHKGDAGISEGQQAGTNCQPGGNIV